MNKMSVRAFTIMEVLVSMVVTAVILGIIFVIFSIMIERMADYRNQNEPVSEMNRLTYAINKDIFESGKMHIEGNELKFETYAGITTKMIFYKEYFVRQKLDFLDTFRINVSRINIDSVYGKNKKTAFQRLMMDIKVDSTKVGLQFYKRIYANDLLKQEKK